MTGFHWGRCGAIRWIGISLLNVIFCFSYGHAAERRTNIILIVVDDLGYGELGCQGNTEIPTPHIDAIARTGVRFTQGYVAASFCSPSRAGLMTGRFPSRFGYEMNPVGAANSLPHVGLPSTEATLAEILQKAGYATGLIGKWHLGGTAAYHPLRRGFDEFFGFLHEGHYYVPQPYQSVATFLRRRALPDGSQGRWISGDGSLILSTHLGTHEPAYDADNPLLRGSQPVLEPGYLTDVFAREACEFIERNSARPFFLCLSFNAVHSPMQARQRDMEKFRHIEDVHRRMFAAMLSSLDEAVGRVQFATEVLLPAETQTLMFFISDNGGPTRELTSSNTPLRGGKGDVYEGGIRVPLMMKAYHRRLPQKIYDRPVSSLDLFATSLAAAGIKIPEGVDGVDLLPYLDGKATGDPHDVLYWRQGNRKAVRRGDWKLLQNPNRGGQPEWELYNLATDLGEERNVASREREKVAELRKVWDAWEADLPGPIRP